MSKPGAKTTYFFCYGTLKRGDIRNGVMDSSMFVGNAKTKSDLTLYDCIGYPAMVHTTDQEFATGVEGEVYEIKESLLDYPLDGIEGRPWLYDRETIEVTLEDGKTVDAVTYIYQRPVEGKDHLGKTWDVTRNTRKIRA